MHKNLSGVISFIRGNKRHGIDQIIYIETNGLTFTCIFNIDFSSANTDINIG